MSATAAPIDRMPSPQDSLNHPMDVISRPGLVYIAETGNDALRLVSL